MYSVEVIIGGLAVLSGASLYLWSQLNTLKVKVITVIDGDTFQVVSRKGKQLKIRLRGVDCPELMQKNGPEAAQYAAQLVHKKWVKIRKYGRDRYGRTVADIKTSKGDLATLMVKAGWAHVLKNRTGLRIYELRARMGRRGLWSQFWVTKPWNHQSRKAKR